MSSPRPSEDAVKQNPELSARAGNFSTNCRIVLAKTPCRHHPEHTGQQSVQRYPFNAADALILLDQRNLTQRKKAAAPKKYYINRQSRPAGLRWRSHPRDKPRSTGVSPFRLDRDLARLQIGILDDGNSSVAANMPSGSTAGELSQSRLYDGRA